MGRKSPLDQYMDKVLLWNSQGVERNEMARRLGVEKYQVESYLSRRKIRAVRQGDGKHLDRELVTRLIEVEKKTHQEVAALAGCSRSAVERAAKHWGLKTYRTGPRSCEGHRQRWNGGRMLDKHGYILVFVPLHPQASNTGYAREHRLVMEVVLGRYLSAQEVIDHRDSHPWHNWPDNLRVYASNADHLKATLTGREKSTPRKSIPGAYGNNQKIFRCPEQSETLALCPEETIRLLEMHIRAHRPTKEQAAQARKTYFRSGAIHPVFRSMSTG